MTHPSPERTSQPRAKFPQTSDQTPSGRTSRLRPAIPVQTRPIISDWTVSGSQTGHLRTDWRATVTAQTSKFRLGINVQAQSLQMHRHSTNHLRRHSLKPDIQTQPRHPSAGWKLSGWTPTSRERGPPPDLQGQTGHFNSTKELQLSLRRLTQHGKAQTTTASDHRSRLRPHTNSN